MIVSVLLLATCAAAEDGKYSYAERAGDRLDLWMAKFTFNKEHQIQVMNKIIAKRQAHIQTKADAAESAKLAKDQAQLSKLQLEQAKNSEGVLTRVMNKLKGKGTPTQGVENALQQQTKTQTQSQAQDGTQAEEQEQEQNQGNTQNQEQNQNAQNNSGTECANGGCSNSGNSGSGNSPNH